MQLIGIALLSVISIILQHGSISAAGKRWQKNSHKFVGYVNLKGADELKRVRSATTELAGDNGSLDPASDN